MVEHFQGVVEIAGIGALRFDHGKEFPEVVSKEVAAHHTLPGKHPIGVSPQCIDLAIVAHEAIGLGAIPTRKGVRREAGVNHGEMALVGRVLQVRVIGKQLMSGQHPLVDEHLRRERADVEHQSLSQAASPQPVARPFSNDEQLAFQGLLIEERRPGDEELFHGRLGGPSRGTDVRRRRHCGDRAPAEKPLPLIADDLVDHFLAGPALLGISRQEDVSHTIEARRREFRRRDRREELVRERRQDPRAVARVLLTPASAPMDQVAQDLDSIVDDAARSPPFDMGHETDSATVVLVGRVVETAGRRESTLRELSRGSLHRLLPPGPGMCLEIPPRSSFDPLFREFGRRVPVGGWLGRSCNTPTNLAAAALNERCRRCTIPSGR